MLRKLGALIHKLLFGDSDSPSLLECMFEMLPEKEQDEMLDYVRKLNEKHNAER
jgi:hypothetical protein